MNTAVETAGRSGASAGPVPHRGAYLRRLPSLGRTLACLVLGPTLLAALLPGPGGAQEPPLGGREVVTLEFRGNQAFTDDALASAIETRATGCRNLLFQIIPLCPLTDWSLVEEEAYLDEEQLPLDVLRLRIFYRQRGYRDARVDTTVDRRNGEVAVAFRIEEGEPTRIDSLRIEGLAGVRGVDLEELRRDIGLEEGGPFDRILLESDRSLIRSRLANEGYVNAAVLEESIVPDSGGARVTLEVRPGTRVRVGEIRIRGSEKIGDRVIREFLTLEEGDFYSEAEVQESQRALFQLGAIRFASISRSESAPADSTVDLLVQVTEAETRTVRLGGGVNTSRCFQTEATFTHRNFLGRARRLQLTGRLANILAPELGGSFPCTDVADQPRDSVFRELNFLLQAEFEQPYFLSSRNRFRASLFVERETFPEIFVRNGRGAELAVIRRVRPRMPVTLSYRPELTSFGESSADVFFCVNFGICQPEDIQVLEESQWLSPLGLSWRYDRTNVPFSPSDGWYASADAEVANVLTGSSYDYARLVLESAGFEPLESDLVLAGRVRVGAVQPTGVVFDLDAEPEDEVVHPRKRFFAGGAQSVRGFGQNLLGPTVLLLNAETALGTDSIDDGEPCFEITIEQCAVRLARTDPGLLDQRPVGGNVAFELSVELRKSLGATWGLVGFVDAGQVWEDFSGLDLPVLTPGLGVRYASPVGPLRVDLAYNPTGGERLPVIAQLPSGFIIPLDERVVFRPFTFDDPGFVTETWRRLQLHLSIGQAF